MNTASNPVLFMKSNVAGYTRKDGTVVAPHTWYLHKTEKNGSKEHRRDISDGKPNFAGSGKKFHAIYEHADGTVIGKSENGRHTKHASFEEAKAYLDKRMDPPAA